MDELKPCPFCGGKVTMKNICQHSSYFQVDCECGASGPIAGYDYQLGDFQRGMDLAIEAWNTRESNHEKD